MSWRIYTRALTGTIETDACTLTYKVEGHGEPAVFIQGVGLHGDGWLPQTGILKSGGLADLLKFR